MRTITISMSEKDKTLVILSNSIAKSRYNLSLPTQKLLLYLISKINYEERKEGKFLNSLEFSLEEMYNLLKFSGRENSKDLKGILKNSVSEIGRNSIKWSKTNNRGKEYWVEYPWAVKAEIDEDKGIFVYKFNNEISDILLPLQNYFKSDVREYLQLSSSHAISLYMLFRSDDFKNKIQSYYIEEIKEKLGVKDKYSEWSELKRVVVDPSIEQLNKETDYFFSYEAKRIGRSIGKVEIRVIDKKNKEKFSDFLSEKIEEFLKEKKLDSNIRKRFELVKYEYDAKENIIYISYKDQASKTKIIEYYKTKEPNGDNELKRFLDPFIAENIDFQKFLKNMFRKGVKVIYGINENKK